MSETCPKCGEEMHYSNPSWGVTHTPDSIACLRNQLTAAQAENERLRTLLAAYRKGEVPTEDVIAAFGDPMQATEMPVRTNQEAASE